MMRESFERELCGLILGYSREDGLHDTPVPGLRCLVMSHPSTKLPAVCTPSLCVIAQGDKRVLLEQEIHHYGPSQFLAVSVDLPILGEVLTASPEAPYLCLQIDLDARLLGEISAQTGVIPGTDHDSGRGLFVGDADDRLLESVLRLARLLDDPRDAVFLAPMISREIHYRLLGGAYGPRIARVAAPGGTMPRIAEAIRLLKADLARPVRVAELARVAGMSPSAFHRHFKDITAMSPLQYVKRLRLTEARQLMLAERVTAAGAAYRVGYESPSQFSRDYARLFGDPPMRDIGRIRTGVSAAI